MSEYIECPACDCNRTHAWYQWESKDGCETLWYLCHRCGLQWRPTPAQLLIEKVRDVRSA